MQKENKKLKELDQKLDIFKQECKRLKPLDMPEKIGHTLLRLGFLKDLKGFNLTK